MQRLYYNNSYLTTFEAEVIEAREVDGQSAVSS